MANKKGYTIGALKKQIVILEDTICDDNRMIAHYDNDIERLKKRIKELEEENWKLKEEISRPSIGNLGDAISR